MNTNLFLLIFGSLTTIYLIIGTWASKNIKTTQDYFLANRNLGLWPVTFTLIATQLGGGMLLGTSQKAYEIGFLGIFYTLGISLGFIILASGLAGKLRALNISTTAEIFETKYKSKKLKKFASLLSIVTLCGILVSQVVASKSLLLGLNINNEFLFILFWAFIIIYTIMGGLKAVIYTDIAQVILIILVFSFIFFKQIFFNNNLNIIKILSYKVLNNNFNLSFTKLLPTLLMPALYALIEQDLAQRFFAAKNKKIAISSALITCIFLLSFAIIPVYFGIYANILNLNIAPNSSPLIPVISKLASPLIFILAICGIIAAITSTADSLLCAISSNIAQDFDFNFIKKSNFLNKFSFINNNLFLPKAITLFTGVITFICSYLVSHNIINILISSYEISVSCLLVPTLWAIFANKNKYINYYSALLSIIFGLTSFIIFRFHPISLHELYTIGLSLSGYILGLVIKPK